MHQVMISMDSIADNKTPRTPAATAASSASSVLTLAPAGSEEAFDVAHVLAGIAGTKKAAADADAVPGLVDSSASSASSGSGSENTGASPPATMADATKKTTARVEKRKAVDADTSGKFPDQLRRMLTYATEQDSKPGEDTEGKFCIAWTPDGTAIQIRDRKSFVENVLPIYFKRTQYASFVRKLYRWGFQRISSQPNSSNNNNDPNGNSKNSKEMFANPHFTRDGTHHQPLHHDAPYPGASGNSQAQLQRSYHDASRFPMMHTKRRRLGGGGARKASRELPPRGPAPLLPYGMPGMGGMAAMAGMGPGLPVGPMAAGGSPPPGMSLEECAMLERRMFEERMVEEQMMLAEEQQMMMLEENRMVQERVLEERHASILEEQALLKALTIEERLTVKERMLEEQMLAAGEVAAFHGGHGHLPPMESMLAWRRQQQASLMQMQQAGMLSKSPAGHPNAAHHEMMMGMSMGMGMGMEMSSVERSRFLLKQSYMGHGPGRGGGTISNKSPADALRAAHVSGNALPNAAVPPPSSASPPAAILPRHPFAPNKDDVGSKIAMPAPVSAPPGLPPIAPRTEANIVGAAVEALRYSA